MYTFTTPNNCNYIRFSYDNSSGTDVMLNTGSTALPYESYVNTWNTKSYAKIVDTTQQVTSFPVVVRPMENTIPSWTIKGNMSQTGTPTPQNPITPSETGERTGNLLNPDSKTTNQYGVERYGSSFPAGTYYILNNTETAIFYRDGLSSTSGNTISPNSSVVATTNNELVVWHTDYTIDIMVANSSTALPFEPYGYELDIKSANTTTPVYLGEIRSTRRIKKLVLTGEEGWKILNSDNTKHYLDYLANDYLRANSQITYMCTHYIPYAQTVSATLVPNLKMSMSSGNAQRLYIADANYTTNESFIQYLQQQYTNGTPVTIWYVLAEPTTGIVNEPLRKIGDYADTVSGITIPTITGKDTFDVETTLKPSEVELTYTGWHDASVGEWNGSQWQ